MIKGDLHRTATKTRWISPKGFNVVTRKQDFSMPVTSRHSIMKDGFKTIQNSTFVPPIEPYEDPDLNPGFVRTTKDYLKQSTIKKHGVMADAASELKDATMDKVLAAMAEKKPEPTDPVEETLRGASDH